MNFLEKYAMFMGIAQIMEMNLKQLLAQRYGVEFEKLERKTMGGLAKDLEDHGCRPDFVALLRSVVKRRNHIAHGLLASQFMLIDLGFEEARFEVSELEKAIYELEQLWFLFEWTEENNGWGENSV